MPNHHYSFIGNRKTYFARTLGDLIAEGASGEGSGGVIIDGSSGSMEAANMKEVLDGGRTVAIHHPNRELLRDVLSLAGYAPGTDCYGLLVRKHGGKARVHAIPLVRGVGAGSGLKGYTGPDQGSFNNSAAEFLSALRADNLFPARPRTSADGNTMIPPAGSSSGMTQLIAYNSPVQVPWPNEGNMAACKVGYTDDPESWYALQALNVALNVNVYVYWCNGRASEQPYFVVMMQMLGPQESGTLVSDGANGTDSNGFILSQVQPSTSTVTYTGSGTAPAITLTGHTAGALSPDGSTLEVAPQASIDVFANSPNGGQEEITQTVGWNDSYTYVDWGSSDNTAGGVPSFMFAETSPTNYFVDTWQSFATWGASEFNGDPGSGTPLTHSTLSTTSAPYQAATVWQVLLPSGTGTPQGAPPSTYPVQCTFSYSINLQLYHNEDGCSGDYDPDCNNDAHQFTQTYSVSGTYTIDLGQIVTSGQPIATPPAAISGGGSGDKR